MSDDNSSNAVYFARPGEGCSVWLSEQDTSQHMIMLGISGRGRSSLLEQEAARRGISYQELLKSMEPTQEEKEIIAMQNQERKQREEVRMQAVRDAYWLASDHSQHEFSAIHDGLVNFCGIDSPTFEQQKAAYDMLPSSIIGSGIQWGFDDSVVRDDIYCHFESNAAEIRAFF